MTKGEILSKKINNLMPIDPNVYKDILDAMEEYANQSRWISVEERLPDNNDNVLVFANKTGEQIEVAFYNEEDKEWNGLNDYWLQHITHWQKLPKKP